jgi:farnesyl diphosphate synthase
MENNNNNSSEQTEAEAFNEALDPFVADITSLDIIDVSSNKEAKEIKVALDWFREAIYYNLPHGKRNRGLAVVMTHKILSEHYKQQPDLRRARLIGWCIEMLQTHFLILDDIMDESLTRRGQKCWHLKKNVGNIAINDSFFMQQSIFYILKKHFTNRAYFNDLVILLNDTMLRTTLGQCLDLKSSAKPGEIPDLSRFTQDKYDAIIDHKTAFYSFSAPVRLGMILSGLVDPHIHHKADVILRRMGQFFQVQDDYLDCFGDPLVMGKIGTDIEEGKCCWPIVTALSLANEKQRATLEQNYARKDKQNVEAVKRIYRELNIEAIYKTFEINIVLELRGLIDDFSKETKIPSEIFYFMLFKICGRQK